MGHSLKPGTSGKSALEEGPHEGQPSAPTREQPALEDDPCADEEGEDAQEGEPGAGDEGAVDRQDRKQNPKLKIQIINKKTKVRTEKC